MNVLGIVDFQYFKKLISKYLLPNIYFFIVWSHPFSVNAQTALINGSGSVCQGDSVTFSVGAGYSTYRWSTGATTSSIRVGTAANYSVTVTTAQGTSLTDSKNLIINPLPNPIISGVPYVCNGRSTSLIVETDYRAYQWSTGARSNTIMVNSPSTVTVTVTDYNACVGSSTVTIRDGSKSYNTLPDTVKICKGDSTLLDATTTAAVSYYWNTDDTSAALWVSTAGRYNVIVSTGQCVSYDTVRVLVLNPPVVNLGIDTAICKGDTLTLKAENSPLYTYKWSDGSTQSTLKVKDDNIYSVEVSFGKCRSGDTIDIALFDKIQGTILDTVVCTPQYSIRGQARGASIYKWNVGSSDSTLIVTKTGAYNLIANNGKCFISRDYKIRFKKQPIVELGKDSIVCLELGNKSVLLVAGEQGESDYVWQDKSTYPSFQVKQSGIYTVVAKNECGESSDAVKIDFKNCYEVFIPSVFSPNGDDLNEKLQIFPSENVDKFKVFNIFDRWGNLVYGATDFGRSDVDKYTWDGRFKGTVLPPAVFVYYLEFITTDGKTVMKKGDITLVR